MGITIGKMCADIGVSRGNFSDLKAGRTKVLSAQKLQKIADYFDVPMDYLLGNTDVPMPPSEKNKAPSEEEAKLLERYKKADSRDKMVIDTLLEKYDMPFVTDGDDKKRKTETIPRAAMGKGHSTGELTPEAIEELKKLKENH